jgi:hypothetical protein
MMNRIGIGFVTGILFAALLLVLSPLSFNIFYYAVHGQYFYAALNLGTLGFISGFLSAYSK